ncbi:MAG: hypothetical protein H6597_05815, partial [Flavobacteriales bacterium]|nr:hypothetical protein [Flavobacteriales bacterium]
EVSVNTTPPGASAGADLDLDCNTTSGDLNGTSPTQGVGFGWTGPNGLNSTDATINVSDAGTYLLTVTDPNNGCTSTDEAEVNVDNSLPGAQASGGTITCTNACVTLMGSGNGAFSWSGPGNFTSDQQDPTVCTAGTYTLTVTGTNGCTSTATAVVDEDTDLPGAQASGGTITCNNACVTLMGSGNGAYSWSGPGNFSSDEQDPTVCTAGTYTLTVTGTNGCTSTATAVVEEDVNVPDVSAVGGLLDCDLGTFQLMGISDQTAATYTWTGPNGFFSNLQDPVVSDTGTYVLTVTAENGCSSMTTAHIGSDCEKKCPPMIISCGPDVTVECGTNLGVIEIGYPEFRKDPDCPEVQIDWSDEWVGSCPYTLIRTWTATDGLGNVETCVQTITVVDNTPPTIIGVPADVTVSCGAVPDGAALWAEDNCKDEVWTVVPEDMVIPGDCAGSYTIQRTWTATDDCGNTTSQTQVIHVVDNEPPVFDCDPSEVTVMCGDKLPKPGKCAATDNCGGAVDLNVVEDKTEADPNGNWDVTWTWTATDDCGNASQLVQVVHVICEKKDPKKMGLLIADPDPFLFDTEIRFVPELSGAASLDILDPMGRPVGRFFQGPVAAGQEYRVHFDPQNNLVGVFLVKLRIGDRDMLMRIVRTH